MTLLIEAAGWIGAALILGSYILVSTGRLEGRSRTFQWMNIVGAAGFVVFTSPAGANRVYADGGLRFVRWDGVTQAVDSNGQAWRVDEASLTAPNGQTLARLPAHRAFWFGWVAQYPGTRLIK